MSISCSWASGITSRSSAMSRGVRTPETTSSPWALTRKSPEGSGAPGDLVAAERHPGGGRLALVAEHHLLDVDRRAPVVGDAVDAPVGARALAGPGVEHGPDRLVQLLLRILGELVEALELLHELLQRLDRELGVGLHPRLTLGTSDRVLEALALHAVDDVAEHLDQPPVGVPGEALVLGGARQPLHRRSRQPDVEDRVEHARHRLPCAAAHGHEQRVLVVAELLAGRLLEAARARPPPARRGHRARRPSRM